MLIGEDEIAGGVVALKNMNTGVQESVTPDAAAAIITAEVAQRNAGAVIVG